MRAIAAMMVLALASCAIEDQTRETGYQSNGYTRYPVVLIPGLLGFDELFGAVEYFHGIPEALAADGVEVFVVQVSQANSTEVRGEEIIPQLEAILAATGADKLNLIGHSAGALDARYIAAVRPDLVASVTSVGGPHKGSPAADFLASDTLGPLDNLLFQGAADMIGLIAGSPYPNDVDAALGSLTTAGAAAFNAQYPAAVPSGCGSGQAMVDDIYYWSWGGTGRMTNPLDPSDALLLLTGAMIPEANDGLVGRCSTHLGVVIRDDYPQNHMDETNLLFGMVSPFGPSPTKLYRQHAARLRNAGL